MTTESLLVNDTEHPVFVHIEHRKNSRVSLAKKGVIIRLPRYLSKRAQIKQILTFKEWAKEKLEAMPIQSHSKVYENNQIIPIGPENYTLRLETRPLRSSKAKLIDSTFYLFLAESLSLSEQKSSIPTLLSRTLAAKRLNDVKFRVHELNKLHFNQEINRISLKHTSSRWGSCSSNKNINLSTRLFFAPQDVFDYVIIHELAHLIEQNHSKSFWKLVRDAMPNYKEKIKWLKEHGGTCRF